MGKNKKPHSKHRKRFQKKYIDWVVNSMSLTELKEECKAIGRFRLGRLSDEELIGLTKSIPFEKIRIIIKWDAFINFIEHVKGEK